MPAQKRPLSETSDDNNNRNQKKLVEVDAQGDDLVSSELDQQLRTQDMKMLLVGHTLPPCVATGTNSDYDDDDDSPSSSSVKEEYVQVKLIDIRKEVQCPICLGIIRKTRTVMECLHRFCRECIDKSMRLGNNECPACRTHCASRRSLRDDPKYDALIAALYPDIDMYEEEEMILHEEEAYRNKMIQESMAETLRRQTEALGKRRPAVKAFSRKPGTSRRGRHRSVIRDTGVQGSDDDEEEVDGGCDENDDGHREIQNVSPGQPETRDRLVWGKGGARSQTRHGNSGGITNGKSNKGSRVMKLVDYLHNLDEKENEFDIHLILIPLDKDSTPSLERPYICCRPNLSIKNICQFIALQISMQAEEIEILVRKPQHCGCIHKDEIVGLEEEFKILEAQDSLSGLHDFFCSSAGNLVLEYRIKT